MREDGSLGRPREFDEDEILLKIMDLFWERGFADTSLSDIMRVTDLRKGSLYAAFGDKHAMYLKAIARYEALVVDGAGDILRGPGDPLARLKAFLTAPVDAAWTAGDMRGCFLCNASADRAEQDAETRALVARGFDKLERAVGAAVADLAPQLDAGARKAAATHMLSVYVGLRVMARSRLDRERMEGARDAALASLAGPATAG